MKHHMIIDYLPSSCTYEVVPYEPENLELNTHHVINFILHHLRHFLRQHPQRHDIISHRMTSLTTLSSS